MTLKLVGWLCICFSFAEVRSQRAWGSSGSGFTNSWSSGNGFSTNNNNPFFGNVNGGGSWGSNAFGFGGRPGDNFPSSPSEMNPNRGSGNSANSDKNSNWNQGKPIGVSGGWQSGGSRRPDEKKFGSITNLPSSSQWNTNSNALPSDEDNNLAVWGSSSSGNSYSGSSGSQNSRPGTWYSNNASNKRPSENEIPTESDREDDSNYPFSGTNNKKKNKPAPGTSGGSGNWETTTRKSNNKWETSNDKGPRKPSTSGGSSQTGKEKPPVNGQGQNGKPSSVDASILDELDKNDWYFGKESDYPKPPFRSTLNIDVSELWNFEKNKKSNQNSTRNGNNNNKNDNKNKYSNNNNRRWNRQIEGPVGIQCECVNMNQCEEEDAIVTQEDVKFDLRPLEEFRCEKLTEVCCTNPKPRLTNRVNFNEEKQQLKCGERRPTVKRFPELGDDMAEPGEFPWYLRLENAEVNCSASLVHRRMALTAAHCIAGALPGELTLRAGVWNSNDEPPQSRRVTKMIPHPDYNGRNPRNDIALLIVETPFELTDNVNTVCLPVTNDKWDPYECAVAGWRAEEIQGQALEVLEKGVVNFLSQPECQNIMLVTDLWRNYVLHDSFVCGWEKSGRKSCTGDEGGFVICPSRKRPGTYVQIGIISKGMNCDHFGRPGIFTNLLKFLDWINKTYFELGLFDDVDVRSLAESR